MAKAQGQSCNSKAVEEAEKNISKSAKAKQNIQMQNDRRRYIQGGKLTIRVVQTMCNERSKFSVVTESTCNTK